MHLRVNQWVEREQRQKRQRNQRVMEEAASAYSNTGSQMRLEYRLILVDRLILAIDPQRPR
jgi:hypothetical protein